MSLGAYAVGINFGWVQDGGGRDAGEGMVKVFRLEDTFQVPEPRTVS